MRKAKRIQGTGILLLGLLVLSGCAGQGQQLPPLAGQVRDLRAEGARLLEAGEVEEARGKLEEARRLAESLDDQKGLAQVLNALGEAAIQDHANGNHANGLAAAKDYHERALSIARRLDDRQMQATSLAYLGQVAYLEGDRESARSHYEEALERYRRMGDRHGEAVTLNNLGLLHHEGNPAEAERHYRQAMELNKALEDIHAQAANLANLGTVLEEQGRQEEAAASYRKALDLDKQIEDRQAIAADLRKLGRLADHRGESGQALEYFHRAYLAYQALGQTDQARAILLRLLILARETGDEKALAAYHDALDRLSSERSLREESDGIDSRTDQADQMEEKE